MSARNEERKERKKTGTEGKERRIVRKRGEKRGKESTTKGERKEGGDYSGGFDEGF